MSGTAAGSAATTNPAAAFYATPAARVVVALLRAAHRWSPQLATKLAFALFCTPIPGKGLARARPVPDSWRARTIPFEGDWIVTWRHSGAIDGAPKVLLVHGWAGDAQQWRAMGERLLSSGFDPVLLDFPAHGRSGGRRTTLPQWVRALFAASAAHGPWHAVVAHSLGALAVAHAAARGFAAPRLALVAASPPPRMFLRWFAQVLGPGEALAQRMQAWIEQAEGVPLAEFEPAWLGRHLRQPTLLIHDRDDRTAPLANTESLANALSHAELEITSGLGHRRILADSAVADRVLQHLRSGDALRAPDACDAAVQGRLAQAQESGAQACPPRTVGRP